MRRIAAIVSLATALAASTSMPAQTPAAHGSITVDVASSGAAVPPKLYGIFYEEISHAGDGGLYAELIQNRGFEDANLPPSCTLDGGFITPPHTPHFDTGQPNNWRLRWNVEDPHPAWSLITTGGAEASIDLVLNEPLNDATPHSLKVTVTKPPAAGGRVALVNDGYWGISVTEGAEYQLSFYWRSTSTGAPPRASLERADGSVITSAGARGAGDTAGPWMKSSTTLRATATDPKARFALTFDAPGTVWLDMVSLFPAKTFKNRRNGLKPELAQVVADLHPGFIRGPGGCFAEGITIESRPQWKRSIGPIETRYGTYSPWEYWSTDGLGYHEFLQFAEDIGADALWVVNAGVSCSFRSGTFLPDDQVPALIQDTLEAIEYAIGPTSTKWGAERAKNGHPAKFPLKYIEVGNEQQGAKYGLRWSQFNAAIKMKYPEIQVVLSSWISGIDRRSIGAAGKIDIVDEHAYKPVNWAIENFDSFAKYARGDWDLYIGEFATNSGVGRGNLMAALNDAVYMMSVEKNSDLVKMASYAPLLENVDQPRRNWEVNMIHFDSSRIFARASYYAQKMFAESLPSVNLKTAVEYQPATPRPIAGRVGVGTWNTAAEFKDVRVERGGRVVYQSDFSTGTAGFAAPPGRGQGSAGTWALVEGALRQSSNAVAFSFVGDESWQDVTISLKARKISGAEGFLVLAGTVDGRRVQWNVGGWNNRQTALQAGDAIIGQAVPGTIETGRWYDARVEVRGRTVKGYLDGALVSEAMFPRIDTVLAIAGRDERTGDVIIKAVNTSSDPAAMTIRLSGMTRLSTGRITTLSSASPADENSFEEPAKIVPVTKTLTGVGPVFTQTLGPYSLSILRLR